MHPHPSWSWGAPKMSWEAPLNSDQVKWSISAVMACNTATSCNSCINWHCFGLRTQSKCSRDVIQISECQKWHDSTACEKILRDKRITRIKKRKRAWSRKVRLSPRKSYPPYPQNSDIWSTSMKHLSQYREVLIKTSDIKNKMLGN